jgi:hypothetical protein
MTYDILSMLKGLAAARAEINLLNVYKGVPLSFSAKIVGFQKDSLQVLTDQHQAVCMFFEKKTYIQSKRIPEIFRADVTELHPADKVATLANFSRVDSGIGNRMLVRVQPREPLEGSIQNQYGDNVVRGELADISQDGFAVYLAEEVFSPRQFSKDSSITVTMRLPGVYVTNLSDPPSSAGENQAGRFDRENVRFSFPNRASGSSANPSQDNQKVQRLENPKVEIHGTVMNTIPEKASARYRIGVRIVFNDPSRALITQFIAQRQSEIIREIKALYEMLAQDSDK